MNTPEMPRSLITYYAEPLPGNRAQLICDVVINDELVMSYKSGSPAPMVTVERFERVIVLEDPEEMAP